MEIPSEERDRPLTPPEVAALIERARQENWTTLAFVGPENIWVARRVERIRRNTAGDPAWSEEHIACVSGFTTDDCRSLGELASLRSLEIGACDIGDDGAAELAKLTKLTSLDLGHNSIGDDGAAELAKLTKLTSLNLWGNKIGDKGAAELAKRTKLTSLDLSHNNIGDKGAAELATLTSLTSLDLGHNELTLTQGLLESIRAMPDLAYLHIHYNRDLGIDDDDLPPDQPAVIVERLAARLEGTAQPWREVKIALLGDGEVGKSMLRWRVAPLEGEAPPVAGPVGRTRAWERRTLPFDVPAERDGGSGRTSGSDSVEVTAHLFDFGGQTFLWGSHRLFLGVSRSFYTIVARADKPLDGPDNRVTHWLHMVMAMRDERIRMKAEAEHRRVIDCRDERSSEWVMRDRADVIREIADELAKSIPYPPVVIVITRANEKIESFDADLQRLENRLREFIPKLGEIPVRVVDLGTHVERAAKDADGVKVLWNQVLAGERGAAIPEIWTSTDTKSFKALREALKAKFPPIDSSEGIPGNHDVMPWVTEKQCREEITRADSSVDPGLAVQYVSELRDVGIVHWVGDAPDHLVAAGDGVRDLIFNPGWTARPLCEVLWGDAKFESQIPIFAKRGGVYREAEMLIALGELLQASDQNGARRLLDLAVASRIVFTFWLDGESRYLVPEHFQIKQDVTPDAGFHLRWRPDFVADATMPRLIGALWDLRDGETVYRNRMGLKVTLNDATGAGKTARATLAQVEVEVGKMRMIELVTLSGDAKAGTELVRRVSEAVYSELRVDPETGEEMPEESEDQSVNKWTWKGGQWFVQFAWEEESNDGTVNQGVEKATLAPRKGVELIGRLLEKANNDGCRVGVLELNAPAASPEERARTRKSAKSATMPPMGVIIKYREAMKESLEQMDVHDPEAQALKAEAAQCVVKLENAYPWLTELESNTRKLADSTRQNINRVHTGPQCVVGCRNNTERLAKHLKECIRVEGFDVVYTGNVVRWEPPRLPPATT
jgi:hypothetical protein